MNELVSIIVPVYNVEKYICECLNSIIEQTHKIIEIILVDDGSTDNSGKICDEYAKKDSRIRVIHKENGGQGSARNTGLKMAVGKYVLFIDSDDWVEENYVELLLRYKTKDNITCCGYKAVYDEKVEMHALNKISEDKVLDFIDKMLSFELENANGRHINPIGNYMWNKMWNRSSFEFIEFENCKFEDINIFLKLAFQYKSIIILPNTLYNYRQRSDSTVYSIKNKSCRDLIDALLNQEEDLKKYDKLYKKIKTLTAAMTVSCMKCDDISENDLEKYKAIAKNRLNIKLFCYKRICIKLFLFLYIPKLYRYIAKKYRN